LESFLESKIDGIILNGVMAENLSHMAQLWKLRETCGLASLKSGYCLKMDVSLPHSHMYHLVETLRAKIDTNGITIGFGHLGDQNLHINISIPDPERIPYVKSIVEPFVYEYL
jgi:FAD/FMN-containing dehydrogenase